MEIDKINELDELLSINMKYAQEILDKVIEHEHISISLTDLKFIFVLTLFNINRFKLYLEYEKTEKLEEIFRELENEI